LDGEPASADQAAGGAGGAPSFGLAAFDASIHSQAQSAAKTMMPAMLHHRQFEQLQACGHLQMKMRISQPRPMRPKITLATRSPTTGHFMMTFLLVFARWERAWRDAWRGAIPLLSGIAAFFNPIPARR
jgi:hypothetical protein